MMNSSVKINYLYHSGFTVETKNYLLIFDYFKDSVDNGKKKISKGAIGEGDLFMNKHILVFSSHSHKDHYNPVILNWVSFNKDIRYIFSSDVEVTIKDYINVVCPYEKIEVKNASIETFGSTDLGVSFLVTIDNLTIFHAGDLNWWHWSNDSFEEQKEAEKLFKEEINKIKGRSIDIAFFPVDPRLESKYFVGGGFFIEQLKPKVFIPMHFEDNYEITKRFKRDVYFNKTKIIELEKRGQEIQLDFL